jgi:CheY-like chemotaxis protein
MTVSYKILLADDSVTVQKIITLTFSDEGVDVLAVDNGDDAIKRLQHLRPALVMADVSIPGRNGYEICEYVKSHPEMKNTPVVLLVPAFEPFDEDRARLIGADYHLTKPFQSIRTLISTVKNLIDPDADGFTTRPSLQERTITKATEEPKNEKIDELIRQSAVDEEEEQSEEAAQAAAMEVVDATRVAATAPFDEPRRFEPAASAIVVENHSLKSPSEPKAVEAEIMPDELDEFDDILELDDVLPELNVAPEFEEDSVEVAEDEESIDATALTTTQNSGTSGAVIAESAIDEIVDRVVLQLLKRLPERLVPQLSDELTDRITERVTAELSDRLLQRITADVDEIVKEQIFEEARARRSVDNLLEID